MLIAACPPTLAHGRRHAPRVALVALVALVVVAALQPTSAGAVFGDKAEAEAPRILSAIVVEGNEHTDLALILREVGLTPGEPFARDAVGPIWDHLEDVGFFSYVDLEYDDGEPGLVTLRIMVEEDMSTGYGPRFRYTSRHRLLAGGYLEDINLRGRGEILRLEAVAATIQSATASWTRPWAFGRRGLSSQLVLEGEQSPFVYRPTRTRRWQAAGSLRWAPRERFFLAGGVSFGRISFRDDYLWPEARPAAGQDPAWTPVAAAVEDRFAVSASVGYDSRRNPWYTRRGWLAELRLSRWSGGGFAAYGEAELDLRRFQPVPLSNHFLALHAWARTTDGAGPLDRLLYFGGAETVRGYGQDEREGELGYLLSVEYRAPLFLMRISPKGETVGVGLHAFADAGDAWRHGGDAGTALWSWGAGTHLNLDRVQLRFEAACTREGDWAFQFSDTFNF